MAEDTRERIERLVKADPTLTAEEIREITKVSRQRVHQILRELGYELHTVWRKKKEKG